MKRLILIALIPAIVGCAGMTKQTAKLVGATAGAHVGYQLGAPLTSSSQQLAIAIGAVTGYNLPNITSTAE